MGLNPKSNRLMSDKILAVFQIGGAKPPENRIF